MRVAARCPRECKVRLYKRRISMQKWKLHPTQRTLCHITQHNVLELNDIAWATELAATVHPYVVSQIFNGAW
jgi:hypothetical protein